MGRSIMSSLKMTILPLAVYLLISLLSQVDGKPSPKYFLTETKSQSKAKKNSDYITDINNSGTMNLHETNRKKGAIREINNSGTLNIQEDGTNRMKGLDVETVNNEGNINIYN